MESLDQFTARKLAAIEAANQRRHLFDHSRSHPMQGVRRAVGGSEGPPPLTSFTDNDYLGLSTHPRVIQAAKDASDTYGAGSGASRLVTGNHPLYGQLEAKIAAFKGTEDALVFGSGFMANMGVIPTFVGKTDLIIADELVHTSLHSGIKLSGAKLLFFRHNDCDHAKQLLRAHRHQHPRCMIVVDGVYSMDGDIAPLKKLAQIGQVFDAWLYSDDAHGFGTLADGRGTVAHTGAGGMVPFQMGTLSKAVGSYGGYLAASKSVCDLLRSRARSLIYTTALPPAVVAASNAALDIIMTDKTLCARPIMLAQKFAEALGLPRPETAIVPVVIGAEKAALGASQALAEAGYLVWAFRPPTVPEGTSRLRFCFSASHTDAQVDGLIDACKTLKI